MGLVRTQGKQSKRVPILLTKEMMYYADVLEKKRKLCDILDKNPYFFANGATGRIRANKVLTKVKQLAKCEHPEWINATSMRKYIATTIQVCPTTVHI